MSENIRPNDTQLPPLANATVDVFVLHTNRPSPRAPPLNAPSPSREELLAEHRYAVQAVRDIIRHHPAARDVGGAADTALFSQCTRSDLLDAIQYTSYYLALVMSEAQHAERRRLFENIYGSLKGDAYVTLPADWLTYSGTDWRSVRDSLGQDAGPMKALKFEHLAQAELCEACSWFLKELRVWMRESETRDAEARDVEVRRQAEARAAEARDDVEAVFAGGESIRGCVRRSCPIL